MLARTAFRPITNIVGFRELGAILTGLLGLKDIESTLQGEVVSTRAVEIGPLRVATEIKHEGPPPRADLQPNVFEWLLHGLH